MKYIVTIHITHSLPHSHPHQVCVELCKLLLHLSDTFALEDFLSRRHKAMVALLVLCLLW